ncbi:MAG: DHA2 family efflux MFS transporter permease subunit [Acidimicrobiales bacterium]
MSNEEDQQQRPASPWIAVLVILVGSYAAVLNITVVGVALPDIASSFGGADATLSVDWVVTSFLTGVVLILPLTGWLADLLGRRMMYVLSLVSFGVGALVCAVAPNMFVLVLGRLVQGLGGGALMPVGMAMVYDLFPPHRRGTAMGIWGVGIMAAPAAGPPLGGWMVTAFGWRWIFAVFVGVALLAAALATRWLPEIGHRERRRLDPVGWLLMAVGVVLLVVGSREASGWGWGSPVTWTVGVLALASIVAVIWWSMRRRDPILDLAMFGVPTFASAMLVVALMAIAQFAQLTFLPVELQVVRGLDAQRVGLLLAPAAVGVAAVMPIGGWLADRIGSKVPVTLGLTIMAASMWRLGHLEPDGSDRQVVEILLVMGVGLGLGFMPSTLAAMNSLPSRFVAQASAVNNLIRQLGGAIGVAVLSAVVVASVGEVAPEGLPPAETQAAYNRVFLIAFWFSVVATVVAAVLLPGRRRALADQRARAAESVAAGSPRG